MRRRERALRLANGHSLSPVVVRKAARCGVARIYAAMLFLKNAFDQGEVSVRPHDRGLTLDR
jgi:hypothetical protein